MAWFMHKFEATLDFHCRVLMLPLGYAVNDDLTQKQLCCDCSAGLFAQVLCSNKPKWQDQQIEAFLVRTCFQTERSGVVA